MEVIALLKIADTLGAPLLKEGMDWIEKLQSNAAQAKHVLKDGQRAELAAIHAESLRLTDELIAKADAAAKR